MQRKVKLVLAVWFIAVLAAGAAGGFARGEGQPPLLLLFVAMGSLSVFTLAYRWSRGFRDYVLAADLRMLTTLQAWRAGGMVFIAMYAYSLLPGLFAWPAGLGDMAIGLTAPLVAAALTRDPGYAATRSFALWNALGILDLVVAMTTGVLGSGLIPGLVEVKTTPMSELPLVLIPAFLVPLFVILHIAALLQWRRLVEADGFHGDSGRNIAGSTAAVLR